MIKALLAAAFAVAAISCHTPAPATSGGAAVQAEAINVTETRRIESVLASDEMQGRKPGTPGIEKAASFIADEFRKAGLQTFDTLRTYRQEFELRHPRHLATEVVIEGDTASKNVVVITQQETVSINPSSKFEVVRITASQQLFQEARRYVASGRNLLVVVDTAHRKNFQRLAGFRRPAFASGGTQAFVLAQSVPLDFSINSHHKVSTVHMANVVGVLPGRSARNEYVIFSGHYDHLGIGKPSAEGDSLYNGANDDAAGTTAVIMLAKYFSKARNNERTLVFVAFTAEESGGFGSEYFSKQLEPAQIVAMFNIEMIGTQSKWGAMSAYITGFEKSDMGATMQRTVEGSGFRFYPDPYPSQKLFYRSDNATLAALGVPAHTISTAKMNDEPFYHSPDDEIETLDLENMTAVIRAIARSAVSIVSGKATPTRIRPE
ncbi:MAG TPA: M20/M25/M40 family metallo-hydrolase [Chitinophagaceae bacterium]